MNTNVAFELVELAVSLAKTLAGGKVQQDATLAGVLQIIERAVQAYQDHTGETLDPSLIKSEDPA